MRDAFIDEIVDPAILGLILRNLSQRRALCEVVLAIYRVELTKTLRQLATESSAPGSVDLVEVLAARIGQAAGAAKLADVHAAAQLVRQRTSEAREGGKEEQNAMLAAGVQLIDAILKSSRIDDAARDDCRN